MPVPYGCGDDPDGHRCGHREGRHGAQPRGRARAASRRVEVAGRASSPGTTCTSSRSPTRRRMRTSRIMAGSAVVIPAESVEALRGATLDRQGDLLTGGLALDTPNRASPSIGPPLEALEGPVARARASRPRGADRTPRSPPMSVRPSSVAVQEGVAYLRLGGGCVGCGMVAATLSRASSRRSSRWLRRSQHRRRHRSRGGHEFVLRAAKKRGAIERSVVWGRQGSANWRRQSSSSAC